MFSFRFFYSYRIQNVAVHCCVFFFLMRIVSFFLMRIVVFSFFGTLLFSFLVYCHVFFFLMRGVGIGLRSPLPCPGLINGFGSDQGFFGGEGRHSRRG